MILKFSFEYISTSEVLENILIRVLNASSLEGRLTKDKDRVTLYMKSDNQTLLSKFATTLSTELPHSIFIKDSSVEVVGDEAYPKEYYALKNHPKREFSFCPQCLKEALKTYDPFVSCEVCGSGIEKTPLHFKNFAKEIEGDDQEIFHSLAGVIKNGAIVKVKTFSQTVLLGLLNEKNIKKIGDDYKILCVDLASVYSISDISQGEALAIASFEKPTLTLAPNRKFNEIYPHISKTDLAVQMSDDLILELISHNLLSLGEKHIFIAPDDQKAHQIELKFDGELSASTPLEVLVLENGLNVVTQGDRGILPMVLDGVSDSHIRAYSNGYVSDNKNNIMTISKKEEHSDLSPKVSFRLRELQEQEGVVYEACHGAFHSVMAENELKEKTSLGLYFSKEYSNKIMLHSPKFGLVDYVSFSCAYQNSHEVFDAIRNEGEIAGQLVDNFQKQYPQQVNNLVSFQQSDAEIFRLWGITAIILGIYEGDDVLKAGQKVLEEAFSFRGTKGPRIDYKMRYIGDKPVLDPLMTIRTAMSFKLANIDNPTLCFGIVESFAEFLSSTIDEISNDYDIEAVCIAGSLFKSRNLLDKFYQITAKNFSVYLNREMPIDNVNLGHGIIHASI